MIYVLNWLDNIWLGVECMKTEAYGVIQEQFSIITEKSHDRLLMTYDESLEKNLGTIVIYYPKVIIDTLPNVMIMAGCHGDEIAGPYGCLRATEYDGLNKKANITWIPIVSSTAFTRCSRYNQWGENSNELDVNANISRENICLLSIFDRFQGWARDGFLSLHEDLDVHGCYAYVFGSKKDEKIRQIFEGVPILEDGMIGYDRIESGLIWNIYDESWEARLFQNGSRRSVCFETPGQLPLDDRINFTVGVIERYLDIVKN